MNFGIEFVKTKVLTLKEKNIWHELLNKLPLSQQDIYYTPEYYEVYEKNGDGNAMCFVVEENDDIALYPFLINSVNDLGYELKDRYFDIQGAYGYNGVVSTNYSEKFRREYYKVFNEFCDEYNIICEFTRYNPVIDNHLFAQEILDLEVNRKTIMISLNLIYAEIFNTQYSSKNRNIVKKGRKTLDIVEGKNIDSYNMFSDMYSHTMERIGADKYYFFNKKFFINLEKILHDYCFLFIAYDKESKTAMGSILLLIYKNKAHYYLSARSEQCCNNSVNSYLLNYAIVFSIEKKCSFFHLGGGNTSDQKDSLFKFKSSFSRETKDFYVSKKIINKDVYNMVCREWEKNNPNKISKFKNYLLKYYE